MNFFRLFFEKVLEVIHKLELRRDYRIIGLLDYWIIGLSDYHNEYPLSYKQANDVYLTNYTIFEEFMNPGLEPDLKRIKERCFTFVVNGCSSASALGMGAVLELTRKRSVWVATADSPTPTNRHHNLILNGNLIQRFDRGTPTKKKAKSL